MAASGQRSRRAPTVQERPGGLVYQDDFVSEEEEHALVTAFDNLAFSEVRMRGWAAKRTVLHFGYRYDYEGWQLIPADALPSFMTWLRDRAAELVGVEPAELAETLLTRYPPGAGIGWHRDAPLFGPRVLGISLLSGCTMRFQRRTEAARYVYQLDLAPRSVYVLGGAARHSWQHSIASTPALRYSVTFRTLARR